MGCSHSVKVHRYFFNRGSKSRNKVAVGEPAAGSFFRWKKPTNQQPNVCSKEKGDEYFLRIISLSFSLFFTRTTNNAQRKRSGVSQPFFLFSAPAATKGQEGGETPPSLSCCLGFHNVSRWMTWLPISLKNAAKCDNWYQLQNFTLPSL